MLKKIIIAGTGIKYLSHLTVEAKSAIETSSCVLYLLNEPAIKNWVGKMAKKSISLDEIYFSSSSRDCSYKKIEEEVIKYLTIYDDVCFLTYGHPAFLSSSAINISKKLSSENVLIQFMPGISAFDCLIADLNIDPGNGGLQSYEATEFILYNQHFSSNTHLILWQIAIVGQLGIISNENIDKKQQKIGLKILVNKLKEQYPENHSIYLYIASQYPGISYELQIIKLKDLEFVDVPRLSTLYIPPSSKKIINSEVMNILNIRQ